MKKPATLLILLLAFLSQYTTAQQSRLDSLFTKVKAMPADTLKVLELNNLAFEYLEHQLDTAYNLAKGALGLSEKLKYDYGKAKSLFNLGLILRYQSKYEKAIEYSQLSYELFDKMGKNAEKARVLNSLGNVYKRVGNYEKSIENFLASLKIYEEINDSVKESYVINNLALLYNQMGEYDKSLDFHLKNLQLRKVLKMDDKLLITLMNIGLVYSDQGEYIKALNYFKDALGYMDERTSKYNQLLLLHNMGMIYDYIGHYNSAIQYYKKTIEIEEEVGEQDRLIYTLQGLGTIYLKTGNSDEGLKLLLRSYDLATKSGNLSKVKRLSEVLSWAYEVVNDYKNSLTYYKIYQRASDSLLGLEKLKQIAEVEQKYEAEKRDHQIKLQQTKLAQQEAQIQQQKTLRNALFGGLGAVFIISLLAVYAYLMKKKANSKIAAQKEEIQAQAEHLKESNILLQQQALCSQMNPHFIFNTLNSIQYFIYENNKEASNKYLSRFSKLMRAVLENSQHQYIYIQKELEALELYLELEALRFENTFEYAIQCDEEAKHYKIPTLLLQPYVENAVLHGIMPKKEGKGNIAVCVQTRENHIMCSIEDNGIGRVAAAKIKQAKKESRQSLGTKITEKRMDIANMLYGKKIKIAYTDKHDEKGNPAGTLVEITLPKLET